MFTYLSVVALLALSNFQQVYSTNNKSLADFMKGTLPQNQTSTASPSTAESVTPNSRVQEVSQPNSTDSNKLKYNEYIELTSTNHVALRGPVTENSVTMLMVNMSKIEDNDIVLYLSSPGGSVIAGQLLIQQINYLQRRGRKVHCVADFAASMAFAIMQACNDRYVTPSSILMQHQMSLGVRGNIFNIRSHMELMESFETDMTRRQASRMGLSEEEFTQKITSDWWLYGDQSVENKAADAVVQVGCTKNLMADTIKEKFYIQTFLGRIALEATFSACPLAREPLLLEAGINMDTLSVQDQLRLNAEMQAYFTDVKGSYNQL